MLVDRGVRHIDVGSPDPRPSGPLWRPAGRPRQSRGRIIWISPRRFRGECARERRSRLRGSRRLRSISSARATVRRSGDSGTVPRSLNARFKPRAGEQQLARIARRHRPRRILLTGDVEREAEEMLRGSRFRVDILKVAHHGSRARRRLRFSTPSALESRDFLGRKTLRPPSRQVLDIAGRGHIHTWRTDRNGSVASTSVQPHRSAASTI